MPLKSKLFTEDPAVRSRLEACLVSDPAHVFLGHRGEYVGRIQRALIVLGAGVIDQAELLSMRYGHTTALAVRRYKENHKPPIINWSYQNKPDDIVGKMTIGFLDQEYSDFENRPQPAPTPIPDFFVSMTAFGWPHDHSTCPPNSYNQGNSVQGRVNHQATPVNPKGTGRKLNVGGLGETKYLGFEDVICYFEPKSDWHGRPLITSIPDSTVSDICLRSTPIAHEGSRDKAIAQIKRVAMSGCRLTYATNEFTFDREKPHLMKLGKLIVETQLVEDELVDDYKVLVIEMF
jgi:hypothetical protein